MASPDPVVPVKRHSHPFLIVLSLVAVALSSVALVKSCPPVPAPAAAPAVTEARALGVTVPIVPGIMPIASFSKLARFSDACGAEIPRWMRRKFEAFRKLAPQDTITIVGDEPEPAYSRMAIPYLLMGNIDEHGTYLRKSPTHFEDLKVNVVRALVKSVDVATKTVALYNG